MERSFSVTFQDDYWQARDRFCESAENAGARLIRYPISAGNDLSIDVAIIGGGGESTMVLSSGVHGVEGPFGSAVQIACLSTAEESLADVGATVLIHAVNPFGYAHCRRWNEVNVDLNRNFIDSDHPPRGGPAMYEQLDPLLNPTTLPSRWEAFRAVAAWYVMRYGMSSMKEAVASGQYTHPRGMFFGGMQVCESTRILQQNYLTWIGDATHVVHLDLHTGLGSFGQHRLLLESNSDSAATNWFQNACGKDCVEPASLNKTAYQSRGSFGSWVSEVLAEREPHFATLELGTYDPVRVVSALRNENRIHHYADDAEAFQWVRAELRECFCPANKKWRENALNAGMQVIHQCASEIGNR